MSFTFDPDGVEFPEIFRRAIRVLMVRYFVPGQSSVAVDMDVLPIPFLILILGESPEHHGIPGYVVALVGLDQEVQPDIVEARKEVESVPGTLSGRLLARGDLVHSGVRQGGLGECWVGEDDGEE